ncbi:MAG: S8 family serine peptidase [Candidatus Schekmanbacteria bacterium]|nr:S8 family serine peptidase [Candidatus Schekmanbacteria bacterium]
MSSANSCRDPWSRGRVLGRQGLFRAAAVARLAFVVLAAMTLTLPAGRAGGKEPVPAQVIVKLSAGSSLGQRLQAAGVPAEVDRFAFGATAVRPLYRSRAALLALRMKSLNRRDERAVAGAEAIGGLLRTLILSFDDSGEAAAAQRDLAQNADVEWAELDAVVTAAGLVPDDPKFSSQWGLDSPTTPDSHVNVDINAPEAWEVTTGDSSVTIAVIDSGLAADHPDFSADRLLTIPGWDLVNGSPSSARPLYDDSGHGTHVAGIAAADGNNSRGIAGVCWGCRILPIKVLGMGGASTVSLVAEGILKAAEGDAKVAVLALGFHTSSEAVREAVDAAAETAGMVCVGAAGNDGWEAPTYPAAYDHVIGVGATDTSGGRAPFSNYGDWVDVYAPGTGIWSTMTGQTYSSWEGTSMAAPHVAGVIALVVSLHPDWDIRRAALQVVHTAPYREESAVRVRLVDAHAALTATPPLNLQVTDVDVDDSPTPGCPSCDGDGAAEHGETVGLIVHLSDATFSAEGVTATLETTERGVTVGSAAVTFARAPSGDELSNVGAPFLVTVGSEVSAWDVSMDLTILIAQEPHRQSTVTLPVAQEITGDVDGILRLPAGGRYRFVGTTHVKSGASLEIVGGAELLFDHLALLLVDGTLIARGADGGLPITIAPIDKESCEAGSTYCRVTIIFGADGQPGVVDAEGSYIGGSILEHCELAEGLSAVYIGGEIAGGPLIQDCRMAGVADEVVLAPAAVRNSSFDGIGRIDLGGDSILYGSSVTGGLAEHPLRIRSAEAVVTNNTITGNRGGMLLDGYASIQSNNITANNTGGSGLFDVVAPPWPGPGAHAEGSYWGTTDGFEIARRIYDHADSYARGSVFWDNPSAVPIADAPAFVVSAMASPPIAGSETVGLTIALSRPMSTDQGRVLVLQDDVQVANVDLEWRSTTNATASYEVGELAPDGSYTFQLIRVADSDGNALPDGPVASFVVDAPVGIARGVALGIMFGAPSATAPDATTTALAGRLPRAGAYSATLSWQPAARATDYIVYWGVSADQLSGQIQVSRQTSLTFPNLFSPGDTYCFAVKATKGGQDGQLSNTVCETAPAADGVPLLDPKVLCLLLLAAGLPCVPRPAHARRRSTARPVARREDRRGPDPEK